MWPLPLTRVTTWRYFQRAAHERPTQKHGSRGPCLTKQGVCTVYRVIVVAAAYIAAQMMADITSLRIVMIAGMSVDAGTLVYPFTFTLRDLMHKTLGIQAARVLI